MTSLVVYFAVVCAGQTDGASKQLLPLEKIDTVLEQSILITGIAKGFDSKWGYLIVYGGGKNQIVFSCYWPDEVKKAIEAAQKTNSDLWVTMRVVIRVDPRWRADGKYPPREVPLVQMRGGDPDKYYFSNQEVVKTEARKRQANGIYSMPPDYPIQRDNKR